MLALQINAWRQNSVDRKISTNLFQNLITSLGQDSIDIERVIQMLEKSSNAQKLMISNDYESFTSEFTPDQSYQLLLNLRNGVLSFFPRFGIYNLIVNNNYLQIMNSEDLKISLINYYEHGYVRYSDSDLAIQKLFSEQVIPIITNDLGCVFELEGGCENENFTMYYKDLQKVCKNAYGLTFITVNLLKQIQSDNHKLMTQLKNEFTK